MLSFLSDKLNSLTHIILAAGISPYPCIVWFLPPLEFFKSPFKKLTINWNVALWFWSHQIHVKRWNHLPYGNHHDPV